MKLDIIVQCIGDEYIKRFNWMLSSIVQQRKPYANITVRVGHLNEHKIFQTLNYFNYHLSIIGYGVDENTAKDRGKLRKLMAEDSDADYILFADCDMVYSKKFFRVLSSMLEEETDTRCIGSQRISLDIPYCVDYFKKEDINEYPMLIKKPSIKCSNMPVRSKKNRVIGVGFFQLVSNKRLKEIGGYPSSNRGDRLSRTPSDVKLRVKMSSTRNSRDVLEYKLPLQYHLNHLRDF